MPRGTKKEGSLRHKETAAKGATTSADTQGENSGNGQKTVGRPPRTAKVVAAKAIKINSSKL